MNKKAMYKLSYGLFVLTAKEGDKDNGCIINTAIQAASEPNQMSICVNKANYTHDMIMRTGEFTVSVISQRATFDLFKHFGFQTGREVDKFALTNAVYNMDSAYQKFFKEHAGYPKFKSKKNNKKSYYIKE